MRETEHELLLYHAIENTMANAIIGAHDGRVGCNIID